MILCSPDPQAFRPLEKPVNVLQVSLPTNFKAARFDSEECTAMLRRMKADIGAVRYNAGGAEVELPVKLKVHDSIFVPLAKWSLLLTGNYRCVQKDEVRSIRDAVHSELELSRSIYNWVGDLCVVLGVSREDLVPFEKYANAAKGLTKPSSATPDGPVAGAQQSRFIWTRLAPVLMAQVAIFSLLNVPGDYDRGVVVTSLPLT